MQGHLLFLPSLWFLWFAGFAGSLMVCRLTVSRTASADRTQPLSHDRSNLWARICRLDRSGTLHVGRGPGKYVKGPFALAYRGQASMYEARSRSLPRKGCPEGLPRKIARGAARNVAHLRSAEIYYPLMSNAPHREAGRRIFTEPAPAVLVLCRAPMLHNPHLWRQHSEHIHCRADPEQSAKVWHSLARTGSAQSLTGSGTD